MKIDLGENPQPELTSGSQKARVWTERWVAETMFCPNCGSPRLTQFVANRAVADFFCSACQDQYELKSQKKTFGARVSDGAYHTKLERLASATNPNLMLLTYDVAARKVRDVFVVPKHFFVPDIVQERAPLRATARRAGWVGSNILLGRIPASGRIFVLRDGVPEPTEGVLAKWQQTLFLRNKDIEARGWLIEVMKAVEIIGRREFELADVYLFENRLGAMYPLNNNVRPKIRQQLQVLRDNGYLEFLGRGKYRRVPLR